MPELEISGLDDRIRDLVARAVADAPPAPTIDEHTLEESAMLRPNTQPPSHRNRWIVGGIAGLSVAAAVIALIFVARPDDATVTVPATQPTAVVPQTVPAAPLTPTPISTPVTAPVITTAPAPATVPATAPVTTVAPAPPIPSTDGTITIASFDGIQLDTGAAVTDALLGYPAQTAQRVPDGRIFFQGRPTDQPGIFVFSGSDTDVPLLALPAEFAGQPVLHDAAVVNGDVVLLVESAPDGPCNDPNTCIGSVWAIWPDRDAEAATKLDEQIVWESGYSRLSLSATGVVVGMKSAEVSSSPWSVVIPGATGAPLDPVAVGLEVDYIDCSTCPTALTIDSTGRYVGWIEPPTTNPARPNSSIIVKRLSDGWTLGYDIVEGTELPVFASLDIGRLTDDGSGVTDGGAIINAADPAEEQGALVFDLIDAGNEPIVIGPLGTRMAFGA